MGQIINTAFLTATVSPLYRGSVWHELFCPLKQATNVEVGGSILKTVRFKDFD